MDNRITASAAKALSESNGAFIEEMTKVYGLIRQQASKSPVRKSVMAITRCDVANQIVERLRTDGFAARVEYDQRDRKRYLVVEW